MVDGQSIREVARELGYSRITIRRYLKQAEPKRTEAKPRRRPTLEAVLPRLEALYAEWSTRTTAKQRITGTRLHEQLVLEGYQVGTSLIRAFLREKRRRAKEVMVPLHHAPGDSAQVDFFQVTVEIRGERRAVWMFVMRLMHSKRDFAWLYERADQLSFLDGHVRAFAFFGAVPRRCVYDNLKAAVTKIVFSKRHLAERFVALTSHYLFEPCFARVGVGHDKGGVEARGKGIRLQELVPIPRGDSLEEIAAALLQRIQARAEARVDEEGRTYEERFGVERQAMLPLPTDPFEVRRLLPVSVRSNATIRVQAAWYSVPSHWARLEAEAFVGVSDLKVVCRGEQVILPRIRAGHSRIDYRHYIPELARKPQALRQAAPKLLEQLGSPFDRLWTLLVDTYGEMQAARTFADILGAMDRHGEAATREAVAVALSQDRLDLFAMRMPLPSRSQSITLPARLAGIEVEMARATDYDALLAGVKG